AGRCNAGRIGEREVALGGQRLGRDDLDLSGPRQTVVAQGGVAEIVGHDTLQIRLVPRLALSPAGKASTTGDEKGRLLGDLFARTVPDPIPGGRLVRPRRLELPRCYPLAPQASASTNSATAASPPGRPSMSPCPHRAGR